MLELIMKKISNKIIIPLFILMTLSSLVITYFTTSQVEKDAIFTSKKNLKNAKLSNVSKS